MQFKIITCLIALFLIANPAFTQQYKKPRNLSNYDKKPVHFGFLLGINNFDFKIKSADYLSDTIFVMKSQSQKGFNLGVVSNFRLSRHFDLRILPTLTLAERKINYTLQIDSEPINEVKNVESTFVELPINFKYKSSRYNNFRTYLLTGFKYALDLASLRKIDDEGSDIVKIKQSDLTYEIGFGFDIYLEYFKFSPEIKAYFGLNNLLVDENTLYSNSIESLRTRGYTISFTFE